MLYTVTLNPSIDRTLLLDGNLIVGDLNRGTLSRLCAGGKGINCAEAAACFGGSAAAYTVIGKENIEEFEKSTKGLSCEIRAEMKSGATRTCVKIYSKNKTLTECNEKGSKLSGNEMRAFIARLLSDMQSEGKPAFLLLSGSVPAGAESGIYGDLIALLQKLGVAIMLDCDGEALKKGLQNKPYLVKPNLSELEALTGQKYATLADIAAAAKELAVANETRVLVTVGGDGMIYADAERCLQVQVPYVPVANTVGAGDTVLGVLATCLEKGLAMEQALQLAAAAACAKVTVEPGEFPTQKDALPYLDRVQVTEMNNACRMDDGSDEK